MKYKVDNSRTVRVIVVGRRMRVNNSYTVDDMQVGKKIDSYKVPDKQGEQEHTQRFAEFIEYFIQIHSFVVMSCKITKKTKRNNYFALTKSRYFTFWVSRSVFWVSCL